MVSKEEEREARSICAWTNFCKDCNECTHIQFPTLKWTITPHFNYRTCNEWKEYLIHPIDKLYRRLRCLLGIHNFFREVKVTEIVKVCTRCKIEYKYVSNKGYTKGKWVKVDE